MKKEIKQIFNLKKFFTPKEKLKDKYIYKIETPSKIMLTNIYINWLHSINTKSNCPIYLNNDVIKDVPYGYVEQSTNVIPVLIEADNTCETYKAITQLVFNLTVPRQDIMQYFVQWQRYRKYWWSSITTTPSLFTLGEIMHEENTSTTQIFANLSCGFQAVENIYMATTPEQNKAHLKCTINLETALCTLLLDGILNQTKEGYLRLHTKVAPYKISFAVNCQDDRKKESLKELAMLLNSKLQSKYISNILPMFTIPFDDQINENLHLGVSYTAILSRETLDDGIFHLLSHSTMLKEQVHVVDFVKYAVLLCGR
ncbi:uncharacterized protein LOC126966941 [Leptidea sinapis]|uniref:uncharacterized protein LOC126966941 n=1 Tax=Leptidea sinapis TaxID=189913 RepID=UPI002121A1EE|nr:uncharacterized protein LOC126966941 [Leptidea sinapis]